MKGMKGAFYRLRIGDYRALFEVEGKQVFIHRVIDRKELDQVASRPVFPKDRLINIIDEVNPKFFFKSRTLSRFQRSIYHLAVMKVNRKVDIEGEIENAKQ